MEPLENLRGKLENLRGQLENLRVDGKNWKTWEEMEQLENVRGDRTTGKLERRWENWKTWKEMEQLEKALDIHCSSLTNSFSCLLC